MAKPLRLTNVEELSFVNHLWKKIEKTIEKNNLSRIYLHILLNDKISGFIQEDEKQLRNLCKTILSEINTNYRLKSCGFLLNSPGCKDQSFHVDYGSMFGSVFCNLTPETQYNSTQFICENCKDIDDSLSMVHKAVQFITPHSLWLDVPHGTVHRGIENKEIFDRIVFWILYYNEGENYELSSEKLYEPESKSVVIPYTENEYRDL